MADHFQRSRQLDPIILSRRRKMLALSLAALTIVALPAQAQTEPKPFSPEELDQMLAPIALYDDALLSQILMAASYPLEIVEAARWSSQPQPKGDTAVALPTRPGMSSNPGGLPCHAKQPHEHLDWTQTATLIGQQADVAA
jgi:hypothetical protein